MLFRSERHGFTIDLASTSQEAQTLSRAQRYQLLIVDTAPPQGVDQEESDAIDRFMASCSDWPVLALTDTFANPQDAVNLVPLASSFMPRPIQLAQLLAESLRLVKASASAKSG